MEPLRTELFEDRVVWSVSQVVNEVKGELERRFHDIWVRGEISNLRVPPSGHIYFTLKDSEAQLRAVCFRLQSRYLKYRPEDGMDVLARGSISVYTPRGEFQLIVEFMEPAGKGSLQVAFEQLKARLQQEGLFDPSHKKKLPLLPRKIGVVTSPTGAAIQDILRVLERRNAAADVLICPTRVQGQGAAEEIARGIECLNTRDDIDVIIVGRGGGSWEDLWAFNEEPVARAIYASRIPVVSAVGHEVDFTIADFVADLRAPTPSAAAEIVSAAREELRQRIGSLKRRAVQEVRLILQEKRRRFDRLASNRAFVDAQSRLHLYSQRLDDLHARLARTLPYALLPRRQSLARQDRELGRQVAHFLQAKRQQVTSHFQQLQAYSPLAVLERGYAIVSTVDAVIVRDPFQVAPGQEVNIRVARGEFQARRENHDGV